jgi:L-asparagine transporter-like permease
MNLGKLSTWFQAIQWVNVATLILQVIAAYTQVFPGAVLPGWVLFLQALIGIMLPSLGGLAHRAAFGEAQVPEKRG